MYILAILNSDTNFKGIGLMKMSKYDTLDDAAKIYFYTKIYSGFHIILFKTKDIIEIQPRLLHIKRDDINYRIKINHVIYRKLIKDRLK